MNMFISLMKEHEHEIAKRSWIVHKHVRSLTNEHKQTLFVLVSVVLVASHSSFDHNNQTHACYSYSKSKEPDKYL